ncbi:hypothetical protein IIA94_02790 [Patescibacteria group bacterium]|nr:hypothetical protein [Patescibacteria group bacterium]
MRNKLSKILFLGGGLILGAVVFVGVVSAIGFGPSLYDLKNNVRQFIMGETPPIYVESGFDAIATSTTEAELIQIRQDQEVEDQNRYISSATSYTEVKETNQSGKIDEHLTIDNTFINVTFCDKVLKSRQIFIDGVDVVQRIAYLATNELTEQKGFANTTFGQAICNSMPYNLYTKGVLETADVTIFTDNDAGFSKMPGKTYAVFLSARQFFINPSMNAIFSIGGYGGEWTNIGTLK